jgi:hypothetical protein
LPWYNTVEANKKPRLQFTLNSKTKSHPGPLCNGYPREFALFLDYCHALWYEDKPDYQYIRKLFSDLLVREGYVHDNIFDWCVVNTKTTPLSPLSPNDSKKFTSHRVYCSFFCLRYSANVVFLGLVPKLADKSANNTYRLESRKLMPPLCEPFCVHIFLSVSCFFVHIAHSIV